MDWSGEEELSQEGFVRKIGMGNVDVEEREEKGGTNGYEVDTAHAVEKEENGREVVAFLGENENQDFVGWVVVSEAGLLPGEGVDCEELFR